MKARKVKGLDRNGSLVENAGRIVLARLEELHQFTPAVLDPSEVEALHDMRIAAKRLRYVLELTEPCIGAAARKGAKVARRLQGLLGEIHDCDVMLARVDAHRERLRAEDAAAVRAAAAPASEDLEPRAIRAAPHRAKYRGLESLAAYLAARRELLYERFTQDWAELRRTKFGRRLAEGVSGAGRAVAA